jgi:hypothetical protein
MVDTDKIYILLAMKVAILENDLRKQLSMLNTHTLIKHNYLLIGVSMENYQRYI